MNDFSLPRVKSVAVDSMCFIYYFEANPEYGPTVQKIFSSIASGKTTAVTSVITIAETLSVSLMPATFEIEAYFKQRFLEMKNLHLGSVDIDIAGQAAVLRKRYGLKLGDAIQIATALRFGSEIFITNDKQLKKIKEMKVIILDDLL